MWYHSSIKKRHVDEQTRQRRVFSLVYIYNPQKVSVCLFVCLFVLYSRAGLDGLGQTLYIPNPQGPAGVLAKLFSHNSRFERNYGTIC